MSGRRCPCLTQVEQGHYSYLDSNTEYSSEP